MTLLFFDGFQDAATTQKPEWDLSIAWTSATGRDASTNGSAQSASNTSQRTVTMSSAAATCIAGVAFQYGNASVPGQSSLVVLGFVRGGTTLELCVTLNSSGFLELRRTNAVGTLLGTSSGHAPWAAATWHHVQMKALLHTSTGTAEVYLDGVSVISVSGVQTAVTSGSVTGIRLQAGGTTNGSSTYWDDLWVCDAVDATATQGRANDNFLGDLKVSTLLPSANGDSTAWTKSTGTNAATLLDEVPPNTTDYISTATSTTRELMQMGDLPATAGLVYGIRVTFYGLKTDAGISSVKPVIKETGGTITAQAAQPLSQTAGAYSGPFIFTKPSASTTPFTASDVNALQAGVDLA